MAALEFMVAGDFTGAGSTVRLVDFMAGLLDFPAADLPDFTPVDFTLTDFTASGSTTMAFTAAWSWPLLSVGCGWAPGWAGLITLLQTKATTATDLIPSIGSAKTPRGITPTYSNATGVGRQSPPTDVSTYRSCS
jgi:hypothetical protein